MALFTLTERINLLNSHRGGFDQYQIAAILGVDLADVEGVLSDADFTPTAPPTPSLNVSGIPTADPHVEGDVWSNDGVLTVSAG
jgi:hypothetical protein